MRHEVELSNRIAELESERSKIFTRWRNAEAALERAERKIGGLQNDMRAASKVIDEQQTTLERVRERDLRLIEEWRSSDCTDISIAADELAAAMGDGMKEESGNE